MKVRCPQLRRLPKSTRVTSIRWREQNPGILDSFFMNVRKPQLDPTHPACKSRDSSVNAKSEFISVRAMPTALLVLDLRQFPAIQPLTWDQRVQHALDVGFLPFSGGRNTRTPAGTQQPFLTELQIYPDRDNNHSVIPGKLAVPSGRYLDRKLAKYDKRIPMAFHVATGKKRMGSDRFMRRGIETRLRTALQLIITKGAFWEPKMKLIKFDEGDVGKKWVLQGWSYMWYPSKEVYRMPYSEMIHVLRPMLQTLSKNGIALERKWLIETKLTPEQLNAAKTRASIVSQNKVVQPTEPQTTQDKVQASNRNKKSKHGPISVTAEKGLAGKDKIVWKNELLAGLAMLESSLNDLQSDSNQMEQQKGVPSKK